MMMMIMVITMIYFSEIIDQQKFRQALSLAGTIAGVSHHHKPLMHHHHLILYKILVNTLLTEVVKQRYLLHH